MVESQPTETIVTVLTRNRVHCINDEMHVDIIGLKNEYGALFHIRSAYMDTAMKPEIRHQMLVGLREANMHWITSLLDGTENEEMLMWAEIVQDRNRRVRLGISVNAWWVSATEQSVMELKPGVPYVFLLRLMEEPINVIEEDIQRGLVDKGLPAQWAESFPFEEIVVTGLGSHSGYWTTLALEWAKKFLHSSQVQKSLHGLMSDGPTQSLRHAAKRLFHSAAHLRP